MHKPDGTPSSGRTRPVPLVWREAKAAQEQKSAKHDGVPRAGAFCDADESFLKLLSDHSSRRVLMPQDVIVGKGSRKDDLFILVSGEVEVVSHEAFVCLLRGPNFFGEATALSLSEASAVTFQAKSVCDVRVLPGQIFRAILQEYPNEQERFQNEAESRAQAVALWKNVWQGVSTSKKGDARNESATEIPSQLPASAKVCQAWSATDATLSARAGSRDHPKELVQSAHDAFAPASTNTSGPATPARSSQLNTPRAATPSRQHGFQICNSGRALLRNPVQPRLPQSSAVLDAANAFADQHDPAAGLSASQARAVLSQGQPAIQNMSTFSVGSSAPSRPSRPRSATAARCPVRQPPPTTSSRGVALHSIDATPTSGSASLGKPESLVASRGFVAASTEEEELIQKIASGLKSSGRHDLAGEFCAQMGLTDDFPVTGSSAPSGAAGRGRGNARSGRGNAAGRGRCPSPPSREQISNDGSEDTDPVCLTLPSLPSLSREPSRPDSSGSRPLSPKAQGASHTSSRASSALPQCTSSEGSHTPSRPTSAAFPSGTQSPLHARVAPRQQSHQRDCFVARPMSPASTDTSDTSHESQICVQATPSDVSRSSLPRGVGPSSCSSVTHSPLHSHVMQSLEMPRSNQGTPRSRQQLALGEEGWITSPREDVQEVTFCIGKLPSKDTFAQRRAPRPVSPD